MPFDGSGNFNRTFPPGGWQGDAAGAIKIRADRHDQHDSDLAQGLSNALCRDGQSQVTADIPFNGKKIVNLGAPTALTDAATKGYVDNIKTFTTGAVISGSDLNGRLTFSSPTGANGLSFVNADLSWLAKPATTTPTVTANRLVLNDKADGTGTDRAAIDDSGNATFGAVTSVTGVVAAKGVAGENTHFWLQGPSGEDRAIFFTAADTAGHAYIRVNATALYTFQMDGTFVAAGAVASAGSSFTTTTNTVVLSSGTPGNVHLRPNGPNNPAGELIVDAAGAVHVSAPGSVHGGGGYRNRVGQSGGYGVNVSNLYYTGGSAVNLYIDNTLMGVIAYSSDYRIKKDVAELDSKWDTVKALRPISYTHADFSPEAERETATKTGLPFVQADDIERWGFVAHELQATLIDSAATGTKDAADTIQSPNPWTVIAALTKALQEAMARIEALEGAA